MATIMREITVDVAQVNRFAAIVAKQYDKQSRYLKVHITNMEQEMRIDPAAMVIINARREDDVAKSFEGVVNEDGTVTVPLTSWILGLDGTVLCDISIIVGTEVMLTTTLFELEVQQAAADDTSVSHDEDCSLLLQLINDTETVIGEYEASMAQAIEDCETAVAAAQLVTSPFYVVNNDTHKTYNCAIQVNGGKPQIIYDEFVEEV